MLRELIYVKYLEQFLEPGEYYVHDSCCCLLQAVEVGKMTWRQIAVIKSIMVRTGIIITNTEYYVSQASLKLLVCSNY